MTVIAVAIALVWRQLGWRNGVYGGMPGMITGYAVFRLRTRLVAIETRAGFSEPMTSRRNPIALETAATGSGASDGRAAARHLSI